LLTFLAAPAEGIRGGQAFPKRIISLAPHITRGLFALGAGDRVVGVTTYCNYPPEAKKKEKVGSLLEFSAEKIVALKPDIIFATEEGNPPQVLSRLKSLGLNVYVFGKTESFGGASAQFRALGNMVGKEKAAEKILKKIEKRRLKIIKKAEKLDKVKVFYQLGTNPVITAGQDTFIDEFISVCGGTNIAHNVKNRYARYSREEVVRQDPDVIIIVDMGKETGQEKKNWAWFSQMSAVKNNRISVVSADLACSPAPVALIEGLEEIAKCVHPEAFV